MYINIKQGVCRKLESSDQGHTGNGVQLSTLGGIIDYIKLKQWAEM